MTSPKNAALHPARPEALLLHVLQSAGVAAAHGTPAAAQQKMAAFLAGVQKYQNAVMAPRRLPYQVVWQAGSVRLLSFSAQVAGQRAVVLVPSLINGWEIFDLDAGHSFIGYLQAQGLSVYVVDFGDLTRDPGVQGLSHVILDRLVPALAAARQDAGAPVVAAGYCMGGLLLAGATAFMAPGSIAAQIFMATPWDPAAGDPDFTRLVGMWAPGVWPRLVSGTPLPAPQIQALFAMLDPGNAAEKYARFAAMAQGDPLAARFVLTENWLQSSAGLPAGIAIEVIRDVYAEGQPARGVWQVGGQKVGAAGLASVPALVVAAQRDRLVAPDTALALADQICAVGGAVEVIQPDLGHIGLMASPRAHTLVWAPVAQWILTHK